LESGAVDASSEIPDYDYVVPLDKAAVRRPGSQATILSRLLMLHFSLEAARQLTGQGVDLKIIDVRSLAPIDYQTIGDSVKKTGRVAIVEEGPKTGGVGAEIAAGVQERFSRYLKAPIIRVASPDVPVPFSPILENAYRPSVAKIMQAVHGLVERGLPVHLVNHLATMADLHRAGRHDRMSYDVLRLTGQGPLSRISSGRMRRHSPRRQERT
jgi:pyruvate/2-oxoglutarate/acetoin dehydrogenase E1 component